MQLIGINSGLIIVGATYVAEYNNLKISFNRPVVDEFEAMMSAGGGSAKEKDVEVSVFAPNMNKFEGDAKTAEELMTELTAMRKFAVHILSPYYKESEISELLGGKVVFAGLDIKNVSDLMAVLTVESKFKKIYNNLFVALANALSTKEVASLPVRLKMLRKSADKAFPVFPYASKFNNDYDLGRGDGFIESMIVEDANSQLRFSEYERGLVAVKGPDGKVLKDSNGKLTYIKRDGGFDRSVAYSHDTHVDVPATADDANKAEIDSLFGA